MNRNHIDKLQVMYQNIENLKNKKVPDMLDLFVGIKREENPKNQDFYNTAYYSLSLLNSLDDIRFDDYSGEYKSNILEHYLENPYLIKTEDRKELPFYVASALLEDISNGIDVYNPSKAEFKKSKMMDIIRTYHNNGNMPAYKTFIDDFTDEYLDQRVLKPDEKEISWKEEFATFKKIGKNGSDFPKEYNESAERMSIPEKAEFELLNLMLTNQIDKQEQNKICLLLARFNIDGINDIYECLKSKSNNEINFTKYSVSDYQY